MQIIGREKQFRKLESLFGDGNNYEEIPSMVFVYGNQSTGKSLVVSKYFHLSGFKYIYLNCIEYSTLKALLESLLNKSCWWSAEDYIKVESTYSFIENLLQLDDDQSYVVVLDNAESLRDIDPYILRLFHDLQQLTSLNISTILISQLAYEKFHPKSGPMEVIKIHFEDYTKEKVSDILKEDFSKNLSLLDLDHKNQDLIDIQLYDEYIQIILSVFYKACRDLTELKFIGRKFFKPFCDPILTGTIKRTDSQKLWRNISKTLKQGITQLYMRTLSTNVQTTESALDITTPVKKIVDLPFYSKYLLIAGFLASHNALKNDKRLFLKYHGKKTKRGHGSDAKVYEKMSLCLGPQSFTIDRLLAIFCSILGEKVGVTCNLISQIATLVHLRHFSFVSGENNIMDGSARLQSNVSQETVIDISRSIGFEIKKYLTAL